MKTRNIEVGALYRHDNHPGTTYLGCGEHGNGGWSGPKVKKFLVIIEDDCLNPMIGIKVINPKKAGQEWWDGFIKITGHAEA